MPTYEYACKSCGQHTEAVQAFTDPSLTTCPSCGGALRKVFGNVGISFKGAGFYRTDSRGSGPPSGDKVEAGADGTGGGDKAGDGKSDKADKTDKADKADTSSPAAASTTTKTEGGSGDKGASSGSSPTRSGSSGPGSRGSRNGAKEKSSSRSETTKTA